MQHKQVDLAKKNATSNVNARARENRLNATFVTSLLFRWSRILDLRASSSL